MCTRQYNTPHDNGRNESAHRILETAMKTRAPQEDICIEDIVADAVLLHNITPNKVIGNTPSSLVFGVDIPLPTLRNMLALATEEVRLSKLRDYRGWKVLVQPLMEEEGSAILEENQQVNNYRVGDSHIRIV